ncbi:hypothetical protein GCM10009765_22980 [Fodinicola feengrottensis]|uniref:Uncharacterized protein n=2 Tax=Fodinicola feengrottensis TaxID=435914 RepID=A0ABN2GL37_9ACTN
MAGGTTAAAASPGPTKPAPPNRPRSAVSPADTREQVVSGVVQVRAGQDYGVEKDCPPGMLATSGGESNDSNAGVTLIDTYAYNGGASWLVSVRNDSTTTAQITVYAVCFSGLTNYHLVTSVNTVVSGNFEAAQADCRNGQLLGGGGWSDSWTVDLTGSAEEYVTEWGYAVVNHGSTNASITAQAICGDGINNYQHIDGGDKHFGVAGYAVESVSCPAGTVVVSGSGEADYGNHVERITDSYPASNQTWYLYAKNDSQTTEGLMNTLLICGS